MSYENAPATKLLATNCAVADSTILDKVVRMLGAHHTWAWLKSRVRVVRRTGCWEWTRARRSGGYGNVGFDGKNTAAHRIAYEMANGEITDGALVLHKCDNPPCCNPEHLYLGNKKQNAKDSFDRGLQVATRLFGSENGASKLTRAQVQEARRMHRPGERGFGAKALAKLFGVSASTMLAVLRGDSWKGVR